MILRNKLLPILASLGLVVAVAVAVSSERKTPPAQPIAEPAQAPYKAYIGGAGIIEASTDNINIGTSIAGLVKHVRVAVGDRVTAGQPLFEIDDRELQAEALIKKASLIKAQATLEEAKASLKDYESQYALVRGATDGRAVSVDDVQKRRDALTLAKAKIESAKAAVVYAESDLKLTQSNIERLTVRAPLDCEVLRVNVRPGQYAATGVLDTPLMMLGNSDVLHVRVDIDENDAWRFQRGSRATLFLRGNRDLNAEVSFVRVEPYVTPKTSLTGSSTEKTDTRVLQVIYGFARSKLPVYVGQQMDVFIEIPDSTDAGGRA